MENKVNVLEEYFNKFKELPRLPLMVDYSILEDLMRKGIDNNKPITQDQINEISKTIDEPIDLEMD